ncbi:MAG: hypothetical protein ACOX2I_00010 [Candidatus Ozemobacteraceae bacterium]|jgi:hypothetical protein
MTQPKNINPCPIVDALLEVRFTSKKMNHNYSFHRNIADWKDNAFDQPLDYQLQNENEEKLQTIIDFSKKVLQNTKDIDSEFVNIVNDNFWELTES